MNVKNSSVNNKGIRGHRAFFCVATILMLSFATMVTFLPGVSAAKTNVTLAPYFYPIIGKDSATEISWLPSPNPLIDSAAYANADPAWANATITFTRPDNTTFTVNGPFDTRFGVPGSTTRRDLVYVFSPDMKGTWTVNFTWPGDDTYNAVSQVNTFPVGDPHPKREMFAMLSLRPYPAIGLGQELLVNAWITPPPITARDTYEGVEFTIKKPNGEIAYNWKQETECPGVLWWQYYFDQVGNWSITMNWAGNFISLPCSITRTITVQEAQIPYPVADTPLPTAPWDFPINVYNREWRNIAGPWYQQYYNASKISYNPYTEAPKTAHITWMLPPTSGVGGYIGPTDQYKGIESASGIYTSTSAAIRTVMAGRGYYTASGNIICVDMTDGKQLWSVPGSFNVGATRSRAPVLYSFSSSRFITYDALTGAVVQNVSGISMTMYDDPYVLTLANNRIIKWTTAGASDNFATRVIFNETTLPYSVDYNMAANWFYIMGDNLFVIRLSKYLAGLGAIPGVPGVYESCIVHKLVAWNWTTGAKVYDVDIADPTNPDTWYLQQGPCTGAAYGLFFFTITGNPQQMNPPTGAGGYIAFDIHTGAFKWLSEQFAYPWGDFFAYQPQTAAYGKIYALGYDGIYALNVTNGKIVWHYTPGNSGMETPYGSWPFGSTGPVIGGGVLYAAETEHSPTLYYRGNTMKAVDTETGKEIWDIMGYFSPNSIAYGTLLATETPSGYSYAFSKGTTATTVEVSSKVVAKGSSVLIEGTVMDQSPAQKGTPAVSDASMTGWMEYLHMQQPKPTNTTGVSVKLTAIDASGKSTDLGTVTSDASGLFKKLWAPTTEGEYTIVATFAGSDGYYGSSAEAAVGVGPAAPSASIVPTTSPTASPTESAPPTQSPTPSITESPTTPATASPTAVPTGVPPETNQIDMVLVSVAAVVVIIAIIAAAILLRRRK